MARPATEANLKVFELERRKLEERANKTRGEAQNLAQRLEGLDVIIPVRVGENEKLYGSVTSAMIAEVLEQQGIELDRRKIILEQPIHALGEYSVPVKLHADVAPELTVKVVDQDRGHHEEEPEVAKFAEPEQQEPEAEIEG